MRGGLPRTKGPISAIQSFWHGRDLPVRPDRVDEWGWRLLEEHTNGVAMAALARQWDTYPERIRAAIVKADRRARQEVTQ